MSLLLDAYYLISAEHNPMGFHEDYVFMHFIPERMPDEEQTPRENVATLVRINHMGNKRSDYASNRSNAVTTGIQVQVWFNYDDPLADKYDEILHKYMEESGFYAIADSYIDKDPDIEKLYLTAKFNKKG